MLHAQSADAVVSKKSVNIGDVDVSTFTTTTTSSPSIKLVQFEFGMLPCSTNASSYYPSEKPLCDDAAMPIDDHFKSSSAIFNAFSFTYDTTNYKNGSLPNDLSKVHLKAITPKALRSSSIW